MRWQLLTHNTDERRVNSETQDDSIGVNKSGWLLISSFCRITSCYVVKLVLTNSVKVLVLSDMIMFTLAYLALFDDLLDSI